MTAALRYRMGLPFAGEAHAAASRITPLCLALLCCCRSRLPWPRAGRSTAIRRWAFPPPSRARRKCRTSPISWPTAPASPAKLYGLSQDGTDYHVWVVDFTGARLQGQAAIDQAVKKLSATGKVAFDIAARVNQNYGRQLGVTDADGLATPLRPIFFVGAKLYQIEGIVHEGGSSGDAVLFQQSMDFGGGFGGGGRGGPGGRGRGGFGGGRFGFGRQQPPPPPPDNPT